MRRLHRPCQRPAGAELPDAGGRGARPGDDDRGARRARRRPAPDAARLYRAGCLSVRLLHAGADHVGDLLCRRGSREQRARHPRVHERQFVPMRGLPAHRQSDPAGERRHAELTMRPFVYTRAGDLADAVSTASAATNGTPPTMAPVQFLAGGTTLLDLMKLDVMRPEVLVDIRDMGPDERPIGGRIEVVGDALRLGAFVTMAEAADHPEIRQNYPIIAQSLTQAASQQLRNMATLGGNLLQRTRCVYFRDPSWGACNKREPGSGCAALDGVNRTHAVLGVSEQCIASYPGDFAQALVALDAAVEVVGPGGPRVIPFEELHRVPGDTPHVET